MENNLTDDNLFNVTIDNTSIAHLKQATKWGRIIAIVGLGALAFSCISFFTRLGSSVLNNASTTQLAGFAVTLTFLGIFLVLLVILNIFMLRFANYTKVGITNSDQEKFNKGIGQLHAYFKLMGIVIIIFFGIIVLILIFAAIGAVMR